jgi:hypothetical protein
MRRSGDPSGSAVQSTIVSSFENRYLKRQLRNPENGDGLSRRIPGALQIFLPPVPIPVIGVDRRTS